MVKPTNRAHSRYSKEATRLLGQMIHEARIQRRLTATEAAERAGISRGLVQRIEKGEMGCSIGAVFELATIVGVALFDANPAALSRHLATSRDKLTLLPKRARKAAAVTFDDF